MSDGITATVIQKLSLGQFSHLQSDWDLVVQLARQNNFDVFVEGRSLYFQASGQSASPPIPVSLRDVQNARIERNLGMPIIPRLKSNRGTHRTWPLMAATVPMGIACRPEFPHRNSPFLFSGANFTSQQVTDLTQRYSAELSRLRTILHLDMPWDLSLSPRTTILLNDTDSPFDTIYLMDSIERHYSPTSGSSQLFAPLKFDVSYPWHLL